MPASIPPASAALVWWRSEPLARAMFLERLNRFMVRVRQGKRERVAHVANPGRMGEILLPGTELLVAERPGSKLGLAVLGARWRARWPGDTPRVVMLDTSRVNDVVGRLLAAGRVPPLAGLEVERAEVRVGHSRFDFLLRRGDERWLLEVKSATLVERGLALFPDAATVRGRRHVEELAALAGAGTHAAVLFLVQGPATSFLPDLHNDLSFARALVAARDRVRLVACRLEPTFERGRIVLAGAPVMLPVPLDDLAPRTHDGGLYLVLLELQRRRRLEVGSLGMLTLEPGTYVYVGSAQRALSARVARHRRLRKKLHWHVDHLRAHARVTATFAIRCATAECRLAADVAALGGALVPGFGVSDCGCPGHLVHFGASPEHTGAFQELLTRWRHLSLMVPQMDLETGLA